MITSCSEKIGRIDIPNNSITEYLHGKNIIDDFRNLENLQDSTVLNWIKKENNLTSTIIENIEGRNTFFQSLSSKKETDPTISFIRITENDSYFYLKKNANDSFSKLYYLPNSTSDEILLYDPSNYKSEDNKEYSINYISPSWDSAKVVVGLSEADKEISEMVIIDVSTKTIYPEIIDNCWPAEVGGVEWLQDNSGFIYVHLPDLDKNSPNYLLNSQSVIHKVGDTEAFTKTLFSKKNNPEIAIEKEDFPITWIPNAKENYIFSFLSGATPYNTGYYASNKDLENKDILWKPLFKKENKVRNFYTKGDTIVFLTSENTSNFKIKQLVINGDQLENEITLVDEYQDAVISDFTLTNNGIFFVKTVNGVEARLFHLSNNNEITEVSLPKKSGYINVKSKGYRFSDLWVEIKGWTNHKERYKYDFEQNKFILENLTPVKKIGSLENTVIKEIEITSHDGTMVPLSIIYKEGVIMNGKNPLLINAYGSAKWTNSPFFYPYLKHWVDNGGVYAVAHVRGGGEKGDAWHKGGFKTTKPNTWKDLISSVEYLIENNFTSKGKVAAWGASAGGICIGRAVTERPDLFSAAAIRVGDFNPLRSEFGPNGLNNVKEYGTVKDSIEFEALYEMDSYHHVKKGIEYPAMYLTGGLNDARVPAWQPAKFAAQLKTKSPNNKRPILLNIDFDGGHGFSATEDKKNKELADIMSFLFWQTGHPDYQPKD